VNMPGFTAEASIYRARGHYYQAAGKAFGQSPRDVRLAQVTDCFRRCFDDCKRKGDTPLLQCAAQCHEQCTPAPLPNPCPPGWQWTSGPRDCPTCCRDLGGGLGQCRQPLCLEP